MTPPLCRDERGRRVPTRLCWTCERKEPVRRFRMDDLRRLGWLLCRTQGIVNWCGHSQEFLPWPDGRGGWRLVPVGDPAERPGNPFQRYPPASARMVPTQRYGATDRRSA